MAGFSVFFMQSPSFLAHQRQLSSGPGQGRSNCGTLLGMSGIPSDNHIRDMLDFVEPSSLYGLFDETLAAVERAGHLPGLNRLDSLNGHTLIAFDSTQYFCSGKLSCPHCSVRRLSNGKTEYYHRVLAASIVAPDHNRALPLAPEFIQPQDGHDKQDCESRAVHRWLKAHGERYRRLRPIYLGDDLYANQPICESVLASGGHFLFVCKPGSHKTITEYLSNLDLPSRSAAVQHGRQRSSHNWRWMTDLPIRDGKDALTVNWLELVIRNDSGKITYRNSFITDLPVNAGQCRHCIRSCPRRPGPLENRERDIQHSENKRIQP